MDVFEAFKTVGRPRESGYQQSEDKKVPHKKPPERAAAHGQDQREKGERADCQQRDRHRFRLYAGHQLEMEFFAGHPTDDADAEKE